MNGPDDARMWAGLRAHLDELGALATTPRLAELIDRRPSRRLNLPALAGVAGAFVLVALVGTVLLVRGPAAAPVGRTTVGPFTLEIRPSKAVFTTAEPVVVTATLTYNGPDASVQISHGYGSPMSIGVVEPVNGIGMGAGWRLSCNGSTLERGVPVSTSFHKSGSQPDGMSRSSFMAFINDPRMPAGTWHFYVEALFYDGSQCSGGGAVHDIKAEVAVQVAGSDSSLAPWVTDGPVAIKTAAQPNTICAAARVGGTLVADPTYGLAFENPGYTQGVIWPYGYTARREAGVIVLLDPSGKVVAREGDSIVASGGTAGDNTVSAMCDIQVNPAPSAVVGAQAQAAASLIVRTQQPNGIAYGAAYVETTVRAVLDTEPAWLDRPDMPPTTDKVLVVMVTGWFPNAASSDPTNQPATSIIDVFDVTMGSDLGWAYVVVGRGATPPPVPSPVTFPGLSRLGTPIPLLVQP